jgi:hypothetical protein
MARNQSSGPAMDLPNMRQNGVRSLDVTCLECTHRAIPNMDDYPGQLIVDGVQQVRKPQRRGSTELARASLTVPGLARALQFYSLGQITV